MNVTYCTICKRLYVDHRPFICSGCNANVFMVDATATEKELEKIKTDFPDIVFVTAA